jgi:hypothetical protein
MLEPAFAGESARWIPDSSRPDRKGEQMNPSLITNKISFSNGVFAKIRYLVPDSTFALVKVSRNGHPVEPVEAVGVADALGVSFELQEAEPVKGKRYTTLAVHRGQLDGLARRMLDASVKVAEELTPKQKAALKGVYEEEV